MSGEEGHREQDSDEEKGNRVRERREKGAGEERWAEVKNRLRLSRKRSEGR